MERRTEEKGVRILVKLTLKAMSLAEKSLEYI
jgi:hypothetical protein